MGQEISKVCILVKGIRKIARYKLEVIVVLNVDG